MEVALIGAVMALILVFHPPAATELVVVLPDASGHTGTLVVERGTQRIVLNEPYATSRITAGGEIRVEKLPEREVRASFERVVTALPARPVSFLLYFSSGSDTLTEDSKRELERMLEELRRRTAPEVLVIGHSDRVGKEEANDRLSLQRAERVKADLLGRGIAAGRIRAAGRGEREPLIATDDEVDEPRNRRVEINVR